MFRCRTLGVCLLLLAAAGLSNSASAATLTWDAGTGTGTGDGPGTWSTTDANWWNGGAPDVVWTSSGTDTAVFGNGGAGPYNVGVSGLVGVGGIQFNSGSLYNISGGTIALGTATPTITMNATSGTISSVLTGSNGLYFTGGGTLNLMPGNIETYTGNTTVANGTLQLNSQNATYTLPAATAVTLGDGGTNSGVLDLYSGTQPLTGLYTAGSSAGNAVINSIPSGTTAALVLNLSGPDTFGGTLGGPGGNNFAVNLNGAGLLTLTGANTYANGSVISGGTASLGNNSALGGGPITLGVNGTANNAAVVLASPGLTLANNISVVNNGVQTALGGSNATGTVTFSGTTSVASGANLVLTAVSGGTTAFSNLISGAGNITVSAPGTVAISGSLSVTGGVTMNGPGTLYLSNPANTFSGGVNLAAGVLDFSNGALNGNTIACNGGTLQWASGNTQDVSSKININSSSQTAYLDTNGNGRNRCSTTQVLAVLALTFATGG